MSRPPTSPHLISSPLSAPSPERVLPAGDSWEPSRPGGGGGHHSFPSLPWTFAYFSPAGAAATRSVPSAQRLRTMKRLLLPGSHFPKEACSREPASKESVLPPAMIGLYLEAGPWRAAILPNDWRGKEEGRGARPVGSCTALHSTSRESDLIERLQRNRAVRCSSPALCHPPHPNGTTSPVPYCC
jgi:hypothetical protein